MRLSESLRKNIIKTSVGVILNKFKIKSRRSVLFFEDILANYIKECEDAGYREEMKEIAHKWATLAAQQLAPTGLKFLPPSICFNMFAKKVWINIGLVEDMHTTMKGNIINIETKNELISRIIGESNFCAGILEGIIGIFCNRQTKCIGKTQTVSECKYTLCIKEEPHKIIKSKGKSVYNNLNRFSESRGFKLNDALKRKFFKMEPKNKISFREKSLVPIENTLFHLFSNTQILTDRISHISYNLFKGIVDENASKEARLTLLKNILQTTGWGVVSTIIKRNRILIAIKNLPYGLQLEKDNWDFLVKVILGYLWTIGKYSIKKVKILNRILMIEYSTDNRTSNS